MSRFKSELSQLHAQEWWIQLLREEVLPAFPNLPEWDPKEDNATEWRRVSAMREGFRLCLLSLGIQTHD